MSSQDNHALEHVLLCVAKEQDLWIESFPVPEVGDSHSFKIPQMTSKDLTVNFFLY